MAKTATPALISRDQFVVARRGRVAKVDQELLDTLSVIPLDGSGGIVVENFGAFDADDTSGKGSVRQKIQAAWKKLHGDDAVHLSVLWTPGDKSVPQVIADPSKRK